MELAVEHLNGTEAVPRTQSFCCHDVALDDLLPEQRTIKGYGELERQGVCYALQRIKVKPSAHTELTLDGARKPLDHTYGIGAKNVWKCLTCVPQRPNGMIRTITNVCLIRTMYVMYHTVDIS